MNRKLKIDKSFKPSEAMEGDEIYPNGIFVFNIHRVEKARRLGVEDISFYKVDIEYLRRFFISEEAYKAHVDYWNGKLEE